MAAFETFPTSDIHLILDNGTHGGTPMSIINFNAQKKAMSLPFAQDPLGNGNVNWNPYVTPDIDKCPSHFRVLPTALGEVKFRFSDGDDKSIIRIRIHNELQHFWLGNESVTMYQDETNYRLTTYAQFGDGANATSIGDISEHHGAFYTAQNVTYRRPFVTYVSHN